MSGVPGNHVKLSDHVDQWRDPPQLNQHAEQVLREWCGSDTSSKA